MVDSPIGSLLGCYVFNGKITKDEALKMFDKANSKNDIPTPQDINEAYNAWISYFKLPVLDNIYAFRNQYTFRFAPGIKNDEGEYGFFPLQDDGVYTFFERMFINTENRVPLTLISVNAKKKASTKSSTNKKAKKETKE